MKRILNIIILIICLCICAHASEIPENVSIHDNADVLSPATEKYIYTQNEELSQKCGAKIVFLTDNSTGENSVKDYASLIFDKWGIKSIGRENSVFVFMCPQKNDYTVLVADGISAALTNMYAEECLVNYMEDDFNEKNYDGAAIKTFNALASWYNENYNNVELSLSEDMSEYEAIVDSEEKEAHRKTISTTLAILIAIAAVIVISTRIKKQIRMKKLEKRRIERKKRYMKARQKIH